MELRGDNPCDRVGRVLGAQHSVVQHMQALPHREVAAAVAAVRASTPPRVGGVFAGRDVRRQTGPERERLERRAGCVERG